MTFNEILSRLTGISCPIFGISWNPPQADIVFAKRIVTFLEDRRVLYLPSEVEVPHHCVNSILQIREFLTQQLFEINSKELRDSISAMRLACRKFMDTVQADERVINFGSNQGHYASWTFISAVGELRATFGLHIAILVAKFGLDVEGDLSKILPASTENSVD